MFNPYIDSIMILCEDASRLSYKEQKSIKTVLEDANSPVTRSYIDKLYAAVLDKDHVDFGDIPNSKGEITTYRGYSCMKETLDALLKLATEHKSEQMIRYVNTINEAIGNIEKLSDLYSQGYRLNNEYVMMEYNIYVYTCIQATSSLIYEFTDYIKRPDMDKIDVVLVNNKRRADLFYIENLQKYNNVVSKMEYRKFLQYHLHGDRNNFIGTETAVGMATVALIAVAIVPVSRELVYQYYHLKSNVSDYLAQQAYFLELNKASVETNPTFTAQKKKEILSKQERVKNQLIRISDKLKVTHNMSIDAKNRMLKNENKLLTIDKIERSEGSGKLSLL